MEKYIFLYLKTGGGHLAPARAVAEKIKSRSKGEIQINLADGLSEANPIFKRLIEDGYKNAVNKAVWAYEFLYALNKIKPISKLTAKVVSSFVKPGIEKHILEIKPDKIIIFHFFLIQPVLEIVKKLNLNIPVLTVVTDPFTAHPLWFIQKNQNYIVFSDILKDKCVDRGIEGSKIQVFPFVIDNKFSKSISESKKIKVRRKFGFELGTQIILILGGGDGMPKGKKILKKIIAENIDAEIALVCGKNKSLYSKAIKMQKKHNITRLKVFGYINFVHSLISISDVVITKCGASTFMEILLLGKVPIINTYIWEQEKGNMEFVCNKKMGILEKNTKYLPEVLRVLLTDNELYNTFCNNIKNASLKNGVSQVSDYILNFK